MYVCFCCVCKNWELDAEATESTAVEVDLRQAAEQKRRFRVEGTKGGLCLGFGVYGFGSCVSGLGVYRDITLKPATRTTSRTTITKARMTTNKARTTKTSFTASA